MKENVFKKALGLYGITEQHLIRPLSGGTYNSVYEFEQDGEQFVIRVGKLEFDIETTSSAIAILDFDDVSFGWFMMDLVAPITDIWVCHSSQNKEESIDTYLAEALEGYQLETPLSVDQQAQIPLLLDFLEIGLYTRFHKMKTLQQENGWVKTFMTDRKERIEARIPFVNIQLIN